MKKKVLFVCIHNSARSQMAEAFLNRICGDEFEAHSAGLDPGCLNPTVVQAMGEIGHDLSRNQTKSVSEMIKAGLDVARINFSHGTRDAQRKRIELVRHAAREAGRPGQIRRAA